jgi:acyl carrier protein
MPDQTIADRVKELISHEMALDPNLVAPEANLEMDLGLDDIDLVELIMAVEEELGVPISDADADNIKTVADLIKFVEDHGTGQGDLVTA